MTVATFIGGLDARQHGFLVSALALTGAGLFAFGFHRLRRGRWLEDLPTSRIRSAAQGYVELTGHARFLPGPEIQSPLSGRRCCWWEYRIERLESLEERGQQRRRWITVEQARSDELFVLADPTGECVVDPIGAEIVPGARRQWRGYHPRPMTFPERPGWLQVGDYRYTERLILFGDWLYAVGAFESQATLQAANDESQEVSALMAGWKRHPRDLLHRFDTNRDGQIDGSEWEAARQAAIAEVRAGQVQRSVDTDLHVLKRPADRRPFLLSTRAEEELSRRYRWTGTALIATGIALGFFAVTAWILRG